MNMTATATITRDQNKLAGGVSSDTVTLFDSGEHGDRERVGVAAGAEQLIFGMLSDLSMNRGAYVLREAYSNAYDATKATGSMDGEIDITIPTTITTNGNASNIGITAKLAGQHAFSGRHAIVRVSDNGIGMSERDIRRYFLQYGGSKKRDDVNAIGSKGLGAKAPLSVSDVFEVRSRKDGIETTASIAREGGACYANVTTRKTNRGNGTDVLIPVSDADVLAQMSECASTLANSNIDANLVVNGKHAERITEGDNPVMQHVGRVSIGTDEHGDPIMSDVFWCTGKPVYFRSYNIYPSRHNGDINVIVGGYPYSLSNAVRGRGAGTDDLTNRGWYVTCDPGYLNFTPSRDAIKSDAHAKAVLDNITAAINGLDMSDYLCGLLKKASIRQKLAALYDSSVFTDYLKWVKDEDGNAIGFTTERAFGYWHANIPLELLSHKGINLVSLTKHNDVQHLGGYHAAAPDDHADLGNADMLTITHTYSRGANWRINRYRKYDRQNDAIAAMANGNDGIGFCGHWTDAIDNYFSIHNSTHTPLYAVIITDCKGHENCGTMAMRSASTIFRTCFPAFNGGASGDSVAMMLANGGIDGCIDDAELDVLKAVYNDNVVVKSWDDVMEGVRACRKGNSKITTRVSHKGESDAREYDFSNVTCVRDLAITLKDNTRRTLPLSVFDTMHGGYGDVAFVLSDCERFCSGMDGMAFAAGIMMLQGAFPKGVNRVCVLSRPYADDITDIIGRDGVIAFDARHKKNVRRVKTVLAPNDGYKYGVSVTSDGNIHLDGNMVYSDSDQATMTYRAIKRDQHTWRVREAVQTCITKGFLDGTSLEGLFDPKYENHIDFEYLNAVNGMIGGEDVSCENTTTTYDAGIALIGKAIADGCLATVIDSYNFPYDLPAEYRDAYCACRAGIVTAFRKALAHVMEKDGNSGASCATTDAA